MKLSRHKTFLLRTISPLAWPLLLLYAVGVRVKNTAYDHRFIKSRGLSWPVVSVGNLSVGGTGKTPVVILLAKLLESRGWTVDVLSRGYGRREQHVNRVDPSGMSKTFGDEPLLMARRGIVVYVGPDRHQVGVFAERNTKTAADRSSGLHILDDGFQHRRLHRTVDIVLLQRADLEDDLLPVGCLREPSSALERADICVLRTKDADLKDRVLRRMRQTDPARVWITERRMVLPAPLLQIRKGLAFCAIGDPGGFFQGLRQAGMEVTAEIDFRDHHVYTPQDVERLKAAAKRSGAQCFLTTEKDSVRFEPNLRLGLEKEYPLIVVGLEVLLRDETRSVAMLESLLRMPNS